MNKGMIVVGVLVASISTGALAVGFMGPPTAELQEGQWNLGYSYMYSDMDLEKMSTKWVEYDNGTLDDAGVDKAKIEDFKIQRHYVSLGYGITQAWEVYVQLGVADAKHKFQWEGDTVWHGFNFDNDFAWGWGTRVTLTEQDNVKWGVSAQMNWLDTSVDYKGAVGGVTWKESYDIESYDLLIAFGPTVDMGGWKLYGGPFYYMFDGDWENNGSDSDGWTWKETGDLEEDSNFGGFVGAQFALTETVDMTTELSFTGDGWAIGTGIGWKF